MELNENTNENLERALPSLNLGDAIKRITMLDVSGPIDEDTPLIVIQEICDTHNLYFDPRHTENLVTNFKRLGSIKPFVFHRPLITEELPHAAAFVNKRIVWPSNSLQQALEFIIFFSIKPGFPPSGNVFYGKPISTHPCSYNACMLYRLLKHRIQYIERNEREKRFQNASSSILPFKISKFCTLHQLSIAVTLLYRPPQQTKSLIYSSLIYASSSEQLAKMYMDHTRYIEMIPKSTTFEDIEEYIFSLSASEEDSGESDSSDSEAETPADLSALDPKNVDIFYPPLSLQLVSYNNLQDTAELFLDPMYVIKRITPVSVAEAICLAAINYELDISLSKNPIEEYIILSSNPEGYIPKDQYLLNVYNLNPDLLRLDIFFNPYFPPELYDSNTLFHLANFEGYDKESLRVEGAYSLLQTCCFANAFYEGKQKIMINSETLEYEDLIELASGLIVCYGTLAQGVYAFRFRELSKIFKRERCFKNIIPYFGGGSTLFSATSIRKLKNICQLTRADEPIEYFLERKELLSSIIYVELLNDEACAKLKELHDIFNDVSSGEKQLKDDIQATVNRLMELGMYMRGWLGGLESYPIEDCPVHDQTEVDINVSKALYEFEVIISNLGTKALLGGVGKIIMDIPLSKYLNGEYIISNLPEEGLTIGERLNIVKSGESSQGTTSCIRLSSNWICSTAYRIMLVLGMIPNFQIDKLRHIA